MMQNRKAPKPVDRLLSPSDMPLRFHFGGARLIIPKDEDGKRKKSTSTRRQSMNSNVTLDTYSTSGSRSAFTDGFNPRHEESLVFDYVSFEDIPSKRRKHHALTLKDCSSSASSFGNSSLESLAPWHHTLLSTPLDKDRGHILGNFDNKEKTAPMLSPPQQPAIYEKESSSDGDDSEAFYINSGIQLDSPNSATTISVPHCRLLSSSDQRAQLSFLRKIKGGTETDARYVKEGFHSSGDDSSSDSESLGSSTSYDSSDFSEDSYEEVMNDLMGIMGQGKRDSGKSIKLPGSHIPRPVAIGDDHNLCENPMQLFANIRADLEKVGRMIVGESSGEKFIERARILASINKLATNVPSCVLEHLGKEIKSRNMRKSPDRRPSFVSTDWSSIDDYDFESEVSDDDSELYDSTQANVFRSSSNLVKTPKTSMENMRAGLKVHDSLELALNASVAVLEQNKFNPRLFRRAPTQSLEEQYLPVVSYFQCALLFIDISGFTTLSQSVDPETLALIINAYLNVIVEKVFDFNGDVQKFAGDALFAEWRVTESIPMEACAQMAASCADALVRECSGISLEDVLRSAGYTVKGAMLTVHCGLGVGEMAGVHVGDSDIRREYVYLGDPIEQAAKACDLAKHSEVKASKRFVDILCSSKAIRQQPNEEYSTLTSGSETILDVDGRQLALCLGHRGAKSRGVTEHVDGLEIDALKEYRRLISLYVHPVVVSNDFAATGVFNSNHQSHGSTERHREEAEIRSVYTLFISPIIELKLTGNIDLDGDRVDQLNGIMRVVTRELSRYMGHLRQFIVDDKGVVLIATFGLRGSTFPNMVSERALPATCIIHRALHHELGVDSRIGATYGDAYCGAVGGEKRNEYAVMGPSVNLAARLMASTENPGILVDHTVRMMADQSFAFNALEPVEAKGYKERVCIYEPVSPVAQRWGKVPPNFVGRKSEISSILDMALQLFHNPDADSKAIMVNGPSGIGKTCLLSNLLERIQSGFEHNGRHRLSILRHVGKESERALPFGAVRQVINKLLASYGGTFADDRSFSTGLRSRRSQESHSKGSLESLGESNHASLSKSLEIFSLVCSHLHIEKDMQAAGRKILFGGCGEALDVDQMFFIRLSELFAEVVRHCLYGRRLAVIALDGADHIDEMSWAVFGRIFRSVSNIMLVFASIGTDRPVGMADDFWHELKRELGPDNRFVSFELLPFNRRELSDMTLKTLGLQLRDLDQEMVTELSVKSNGIPRFANEVLEYFKKRSEGAHEVTEQVRQIILHRIDSFQPQVRKVLTIGSIIGTTFTCREVSIVMLSGTEKLEVLQADIKSSLKSLMSEGIIQVNSLGPPSDIGRSPLDVTISEDTAFSFCQHIWQSTILRISLESRKQDVHDKLAAYYETCDTMTPFDRLSKAHYHWLECQDKEGAVSTALSICRILESNGNNKQSYQKAVVLLKQTLNLWNFSSSEVIGFDRLAQELVWISNAAELEMILSVMLELSELSAIGGCFENSLRYFDYVNILKKTAAAEGLYIGRDAIFPPLLEGFSELESGYRTEKVCDFESRL